MGQETIEHIGDLINSTNLKTGNFVRTASTNAPVAAVSNPVSVDSTGALQVTGLVPINQTTITEAVLDITGVGAENIMTQTLVADADGTTWTATGWVRVKITDTGNRLTDGYYYLQVGTLT